MGKIHIFPMDRSDWETELKDVALFIALSNRNFYDKKCYISKVVESQGVYDLKLKKKEFKPILKK